MFIVSVGVRKFDDLKFEDCFFAPFFCMHFEGKDSSITAVVSSRASHPCCHWCIHTNILRESHCHQAPGSM